MRGIVGCVSDPKRSRSGRSRWLSKRTAVIALICLAAITVAVPLTLARQHHKDCSVSPAGCTLGQVAAASGLHAGALVSGRWRPTDVSDTLRYFNAITTVSYLWKLVQPRDFRHWNFEQIDRFVKWAGDNHLRVRAHTLIWRDSQTPQWVVRKVASARDPASTAADLIRGWVTPIVRRHRGKIAIYDVVNEPFAHPDSDGRVFIRSDDPFARSLGEAYIDAAFWAARHGDPDAKLFLNESIPNPVAGDPKAEALIDLVRRLKSRHVPIDGVGLQTHGTMGSTPGSFPATTEVLVAYMNRLAALGVKVEVTELDVSLSGTASTAGIKPMTDPRAIKLQAAAFARVGRACVRAKACGGVTVWGLRDPYTWLDESQWTKALAPHLPLLLDAQGHRKSAYFALRESLVRHQR